MSLAQGNNTPTRPVLNCVPFRHHMEGIHSRLPFGINSASKVYQRIICVMVQDLEGVESIIDDIIIFGKDIEEHDRRLSKDKCIFRTNEIRYAEHLLTDKGVKIDPEKLKAVESMKNIKMYKNFRLP